MGVPKCSLVPNSINIIIKDSWNMSYLFSFLKVFSTKKLYIVHLLLLWDFNGQLLLNPYKKVFSKLPF